MSKRSLPKPWLRKRASGVSEWYITIKGKQLYLAPEKTPIARVKELAAMELAKHHVQTGEGDDVVLLKAIMERYLEHIQQNKKPATFIVRRRYLKSFAEHLASKGIETIAAVNLKKLHITDWLLSKKWQANARRNAMASVAACLNWALDEGHIDTHNIKRLRYPPKVSRGDNAYIPKQTIRCFLSACKKKSHVHLITALYQSGLRPHELAGINVENFNYQDKTWAVDGKTGPRKIALTPQLLELSQELSLKHGCGALFRTPRGSRWKAKYIGRVLERISNRAIKKGIITRAIIPYFCRHSAITNLLRDGVPPAIVAKQMGNSLTMLCKHYSHIQVDDAHTYINKVKPLEEEKPVVPQNGSGVCPDRL